MVAACEDSEGHRPMSGRAQDAVTVMDKGRAGGNGFNFFWSTDVTARYQVCGAVDWKGPKPFQNAIAATFEQSYDSSRPAAAEMQA